MASEERIPIKVEVNSDSVKAYEDQLKGVQKESEKAFNPKKELKEATIELQKAQAAFGEYSKEAIAAAKKVADVRDRIQEARETSDLFDPGKKFQVFTNALGQVANAYQAVQGAIGLLGVESDQVEKQLLKVQSAMAFTQGLSGIADSAKDFSRLASIVKGQVISAFQALKAAIGSTGIGLLLIALGTIAANWDKIKGAISGVSKEQEELNAKIDANLKTEQKKTEDLNSQDNILKLQGKTEKEILKLKIAQLDANIKATEESINAQKITLKGQIEAEKRNRQILNGLLEITTAPIQSLIEGVRALAKLLGIEFDFDISDFTSRLIFDEDKVKADSDAAVAALDKQLNTLKNTKAGYQLQINNIDKQEADKASENFKKREEERKKNQEAADAVLKDAKIAAMTDRQKAIYEIEQKYLDQEKTLYKAGVKDFSAIEEERRIALAKVNADFDEKEKAEKQKKKEAEEKEQQERFDKAIERSQRSLSILNEQEKYLEEQRKQRNDEELKRQELNRESLKSTGDAFNLLADIAGKQTAAGKALSVASALINTYLGITQIWANKTLLPEPAGTINKVAATAVAALSGFTAVKNILKTPVPGGGGGGGGAVPSGAGGAGAPITPAAPQQVVAQVSQESINQMGSAVGRAYVVESDVTSSQERIRRISRAARLG